LGASGGVGGTTPANYSDAVKAVSKKLASLGILDSDIDLSDASVISKNTSSTVAVYDVYVTATIWIFNPASVHRYLLQSFVSNMSSLGINYALSGASGGIVSRASTSKSSVALRGLVEVESLIDASQLHQVISYMLEAPDLLSLDAVLLHSQSSLSDAVAAIQNRHSESLISGSSDSPWDNSSQEEKMMPATASGLARRQLLGSSSATSVGSALQTATNASGVSSTNVTTAPNSTAVLLASLKGMMNILLNSSSTLVSSMSTAASGINISLAQSTSVGEAYENKVGWTASG
jgi:hypothetical protein